LAAIYQEKIKFIFSEP